MGLDVSTCRGYGDTAERAVLSLCYQILDKYSGNVIVTAHGLIEIKRRPLGRLLHALHIKGRGWYTVQLVEHDYNRGAVRLLEASTGGSNCFAECSVLVRSRHILPGTKAR